MKKRALTMIFAAFMAMFMAGCGGNTTGTNSTNASDKAGSAVVEDTADKPEIPDLTGEWKQVNSSSDDNYQAATISGDAIEIYWVNEEDESKSLYWAGTFVAPETAAEYSWDSENDHEKTDSAILASTDDKKTFTYKDGEISYEASALGTTKTIRLKKQD